MAESGEIIIVYNEIYENSCDDEKDVLKQVEAVFDALKTIGFSVSAVGFDGNPMRIYEVLNKKKPLLVFNLVESVRGTGRLSYISAAIFELLNIKYTGCPAEAIMITTNKVMTKKILISSDIPTPKWITEYDENTDLHTKYILKPVYEDGSVGLSRKSIVNCKNTEEIKQIIKSIKTETKTDYFAEKYIEGREMNVSIIQVNNQPMVLPPSEIKFIGYKENGLDEIVDYSAKWNENSYEYKNTVTSTDFGSEDKTLLDNLKEISLKCWLEFGLKGYARIDFRVDRDKNPYVLEINANPCITPNGSGFLNSALQVGMDFQEVIKMLIAAVNEG